MSLELRPLSNRIVVVPDSPEQMSQGGLHIPGTAQERPQTGTVIAVGPGKVSDFPVVKGQEGEVLTEPEFPRQPMVSEVGDKVLVNKHAGAEVQIDRQTFIVVRETDILALVEDNDTE